MEIYECNDKKVSILVYVRLSLRSACNQRIINHNAILHLPFVNGLFQ